jgi:hypothetical protein
MNRNPLIDVICMLPSLFKHLLSEKDIASLRCTCRQGWATVGKRFNIVEERMRKKRKYDRFNTVLLNISRIHLSRSYHYMNDEIIVLKDIDAWCDTCHSIKNTPGEICDICFLCEVCNEYNTREYKHTMFNKHLQQTTTICDNCRYEVCWKNWIDNNGNNECFTDCSALH